MRSALPHRHVFFADADAPEAEAEWACACGVVALRDGDADAGLTVVRSPAPAELDALGTVDDALLARALEGLQAVPEAVSRTA